jgi:hypothetical protein
MVRKGRIEVLVTDGSEIRRLLWLERRPNGVYWGWCSEGGEIFHASYHEDGNRFWIVQGKHQPQGAGPKLSEFKGCLQLANVAVRNIKNIPMTAPYRFKRLDSVVYIDMRTFREKGVNLDLFLLEPFRLDLLNPLFRSYWTGSQLHVFTSVEPWVIIAYRSQALLEKK